MAHRSSLDGPSLLRSTRPNASRLLDETQARSFMVVCQQFPCRFIEVALTCMQKVGNCEDDCFLKERNGGPNAQVTATLLGGESGLSTPNVRFTTAM